MLRRPRLKRGRAVAARLAHNQKVAGSSPAPATNAAPTGGARGAGTHEPDPAPRALFRAGACGLAFPSASLGGRAVLPATAAPALRLSVASGAHPRTLRLAPPSAAARSNTAMLERRKKRAGCCPHVGMGGLEQASMASRRHPIHRSCASPAGAADGRRGLGAPRGMRAADGAPVRSRWRSSICRRSRRITRASGWAMRWGRCGRREVMTFSSLVVVGRVSLIEANHDTGGIQDVGQVVQELGQVVQGARGSRREGRDV